jgi:hypothetical protein
MRIIAILILNLSAQYLLAQSAIPNQIRATNTIARLSDADGLGRNDLMLGIPMPPGRVIGDTYLDRKWNPGSLLLADSEQMIEGFPIKYDISLDRIEIMAKNGVKVIEGKKIKSMVWKDSITNLPRYFVTARDFKMDGVGLTGFVEVLSDGTTPLLKRTTIVEKQPDYVPALDVGSRDKKILRREMFFYPLSGELIKITNKKTLLSACGDQADDVDSYIKVNKLNVNKEYGLTKTFEYYNSKTTSK